MKKILILRAFVTLLLMSAVVSAYAQTRELMSRAAELSSAGRTAEARALWMQVWNNNAASSSARIEAGGKAGESLFADGRYEAALRMLADAVALADSFRPGQDAANKLRYNTALHLTVLGRYDDARAMLADVRFPSGSEGRLRTLAHLAEIESRTGNHRRAIEIYDSVCATLPRDGSADATRSVLLQNRGFVSLETGRVEEAVSDLREALALAPDGMDRMIVMSNLAVAESLAEECNAASEHISVSLDYFLHTLGEDSFDYINALRKQAAIAGRCGNSRFATEKARRFLHLEKKRLLHELPEMSAETRLNYWLRVKPLLSSLFTVPGLDASLLAETEMFRRQVSMLGMRDVEELRGSLLTDAGKVARMLPVGAVMVQLVEFPDMDGFSRYDAIVLERGGKCRRIPLFTAEEIMDVPLSDGVSTLYDAVTGDDYDAINALYTDSLLSGKIWAPILAALSQGVKDIYFVPEGIFHLWGIENMPLTENAPALHRLSSVHALKDVEEERSLPTDRNAVIAGGLDYSDAGDIAEVREQGDHTTYESLVRALGVAPGSEIFVPLPATRIEADSVSSAIGQPGALHALHERDFKRLAPGAAVIHLATHGYTLDSGIGEPPRFLADTLAVDMSLLLSGLAFTGANRAGIDLASPEDGVLSAREIAALDLRGVDLVVMSACQTGRGLVTDEGVSGLVRALKMAGAGTVVASLWEVDDNATRLFMQFFYEGMVAGLSRSEAFSRARKQVKLTETRIPVRRFDAGKMRRVDSGKVRVEHPYESPYYHSAFILLD